MSSFVPQPLAMQFLGRIDRKVFEEDITDEGFIVHAARILTANNTNAVNASPEVQLVTPKGIKNELHPGEFCAISCKFIGSNTRRPDQLHYISATRTNLGNEDDLPFSLEDEAVNKTAIIGLGVIMEKEIIAPEETGGKTKVFLTLKSMDYDPITKHKAVWLTRHGVSLELFPLGVENQYNVGDEVQLSGIVTGYDPDEYMWITEVYCLAAIGMQRQMSLPSKGVVKKTAMASPGEMMYRKARLLIKDRYKPKKRILISDKRMYDRYLLWSEYKLKKFVKNTKSRFRHQ